MISTRSLARVRFHLLLLSAPTVDKRLCITSNYTNGTIPTDSTTNRDSMPANHAYFLPVLQPKGMYKVANFCLVTSLKPQATTAVLPLYANTTSHLDVTADRETVPPNDQAWWLRLTEYAHRTQPPVCIIMTGTVVMVSSVRTGVRIFDQKNVSEPVQILAHAWAIPGKTIPIGTRNL